MNLNIKSKQQGFTIVELLIVIVVIGILAAITIVAYNGIQNRGKSSAAQSAMNTVIKKAEAANAISSAYPTVSGDFVNDASLAGSGITLATLTAGTAPTSVNTVEYRGCTTTAGVGAQLKYYDYANSGALVTKTIGATCGTLAAAVTGTF
jgi:prepilin-type N-terminal cleavage/methylation domain-containing protein